MVLVLQNINEFGDSGNKRLVSVLSVQKFLWEQVNNMDFFFFLNHLREAKFLRSKDGRDVHQSTKECVQIVE